MLMRKVHIPNLKRISNYIYLNRKEYSEKYMYFIEMGGQECILEPRR